VCKQVGIGIVFIIWLALQGIRNINIKGADKSSLYIRWRTKQTVATNKPVITRPG